MADLLRKGRALASKNRKKEAEDAAAEKKKGAASGGESLDAAPGNIGGQAVEATAAAARRDDGCPLDKGELGSATWGLVRGPVCTLLFLSVRKREAGGPVHVPRSRLFVRNDFVVAPAHVVIKSRRERKWIILPTGFVQHGFEFLNPLSTAVPCISVQPDCQQT